ncbi:TIM21 domain containing protein [Nitzschia inconspicua]|uniref:Mitochondrial import inner membrane translocase subunit Tim21 n=1 Tax=Nitzschia inconspicua TaxID=303405 RepID=A0A9K3K6S5_9STRA|nr:TIM21 domain containing protein [Nitzschia inconspicua]KAG7358187.1 TIM21 domain containing protein [Nitzschia inconspicua]
MSLRQISTSSLWMIRRTTTPTLTTPLFDHVGTRLQSTSALVFRRHYTAHARTTLSSLKGWTSALPNRWIVPPLASPAWRRALSSQANNEKQEPDKKKDGTGTDKDNNDDTTSEIVLTPGEKVVAATRLSMWLGILAFASVCAYYIGKELLPTKMSPNTVFNGASKVIKEDYQVQRQYGEKLKFYGKDHGGHREGRRNFIEHTEYTSEEDGSKRTRVRFNMEGQFASAFCFAEVSNQYDDYVYILVQDKQTGRVLTVKDNRAAITAQRLAGGNQQTADAMKQLLGGGSGKQ